MSSTIIPGDGWVAVFTSEESGHPLVTGASNVPFVKVSVVYWKVVCLDNQDTGVGYVLQDREGADLPYPVPAPNVFGFVRYEKTI